MRSILGLRAMMAGLGGLLGLFLVLQPVWVDVREHDRYSTTLMEIAETNFELDVSLLKMLDFDQHNYDTISTLSAELEALNRQTETIPDSVGKKGESELQKLGVELAETIAQKRDLIERFKSHDAILKNSRAWLLSSTRDWNEGSAELERTLRQDELIAEGIRSIVELLLYHGEAAADFSPSLAQETLGGLLERLEQRPASEAELFYFRNLVRHVEIFSKRLPQVRNLVNQNIALPVSRQAEDLLALYNLYHEKALERVAYGRILASLLLLFSVYQLLSGTALINKDRFRLKQQVKTREQQLENELEERKRTEATLRGIAEAISRESSEAFLQNLLNSVTVSLDLEYALIGKLMGELEEEVETLVVSAAGKKAENMRYALADAPCANVTGRALCCYPKDVAALFPKDEMLVEMEVESYCGAPLFDSKDNLIGLFAVMGMKPFENIELVESVTQIVSARVADELERSQVEATIRAEKERFSVMFRSIGDGVIATDLAGEVVLMNREAERMTGWPQEEARTKHVSEVLNIVELDSGQTHEGLLERVIETGEPLVSTEAYRLLHRDETSCLVTDSRAPIFDAESKIIGVIFVFRDVSEKKRFEDEKNKLEGQLLQLQKMETIGTLAGGIAHEFNNLLTPIIGYSSICLERNPPSEEARKYIELILSSSLRAQKLVSQMLKFGRQYALEYKPVQLRQTIEDAAELTRSVAPSTIDVEVLIPEDLGTVLCDENQIHQVIVNLCTNAYLSMEAEGGKLGITMEPSENCPGRPTDPDRSYLVISISDTGCGISPAIQGRIFDPFFTTREVNQGTGLGLSVALGIIESHGGTIQVESVLGEGATFKVYLPEGGDLRMEQEVTQDEAPQVIGNKECILFVDDEQEIVEMVKVLLTECGYELVTETDSLSALETFRESPSKFDLVITDYTMPRMKGLELGKLILEIRPEIPVLLTTGYSHSVTEEKVRAEGFHALVTKPILGKQLRAIIQEAIQSD